MPLKSLPAQDPWEKALASLKVKPDPALSKALAESFRVDAGEPGKRLAMLPRIQKLASDFKKSKEVLAAGANASKLVQELIDVIPVVRRDLEKLQKDLQGREASEVDAQFNVGDWNGRAFDYATGYVEFEAPGQPSIRRNAKLSARSLSIDGVRLPPAGSVTLMVDTGSKAIEGTAAYELRAGRKSLQFNASQQVKVHRTRAKTVAEAAKKLGLKGAAGVDFTVVKVAAKAAREPEYARGFADEVEWEIEEGGRTFREFRQVG